LINSGSGKARMAQQRLLTPTQGPLYAHRQPFALRPAACVAAEGHRRSGTDFA
jgi:hypothetical protein